MQWGNLEPVSHVLSLIVALVVAHPYRGARGGP